MCIFGFLFVIAIYICYNLHDKLIEERNKVKALNEKVENILDKITDKTRAASFYSDTSYHSRYYREMKKLIDELKEEHNESKDTKNR